MASAKSESSAVAENPAAASSPKTKEPKDPKEPKGGPRRAPNLAAPTPWRVWTLRVLTLCGLILSSYLMYQRAQHLSGNDANEGICSLVKISNCAKVENSRFAVVAGVPTAAWGALYFLVFSIFAWSGPRVDWSSSLKRKGTAKYPGKKPEADLTGHPFFPVATILAVAGLAGSFLFAFIAVTYVKAFCVGCAGIYLITLLLALGLIGSDEDPYVVRAAKGIPGAWSYARIIFAPAELPGALGLKISAILGVLLLPAVFYATPLMQKKFVSADSEKILNEYAYQPEVEFQYVPGETMVKGRGEAPIHIVVFTDFLCPHCKRFSDSLKKVLASYDPDQYLLVYKHFPFEDQCNPLVRRFIEEGKLRREYTHFGACNLAALAQSLYSDYRKFWDYSSDFYLEEDEREGEKAYDKMKSISDRAKIDYEEWTKKTKDPANLKRVSRDIKEGVELGIVSIPAVYINKRKLGKPAGADVDLVMRAILNGEIDKRKSK